MRISGEEVAGVNNTEHPPTKSVLAMLGKKNPWASRNTKKTIAATAPKRAKGHPNATVSAKGFKTSHGETMTATAVLTPVARNESGDPFQAREGRIGKEKTNGSSSDRADENFSVGGLARHRLISRSESKSVEEKDDSPPTSPSSSSAAKNSTGTGEDATNNAAKETILGGNGAPVKCDAGDVSPGAETARFSSDHPRHRKVSNRDSCVSGTEMESPEGPLPACFEEDQQGIKRRDSCRSNVSDAGYASSDGDAGETIEDSAEKKEDCKDKSPPRNYSGTAAAAFNSKENFESKRQMLVMRHVASRSGGTSHGEGHGKDLVNETKDPLYRVFLWDPSLPPRPCCNEVPCCCSNSALLLPK